MTKVKVKKSSMATGNKASDNKSKFVSKSPRVLLFDLETSPNQANVWAKWETNVLGDFIQERMIISFSWKWLGESKVHVLALPDFYGYRKYVDKAFVRKMDNRKLIEKLHGLFCAADILVAQNGNAFDIKIASAEFIRLGLNPPPPHKTVDTLLVARSKFKFTSNSLDDLGASLGLGRKIHTGGFGLWTGCLKGEKKSWDLMTKYNMQDVVLLEKVYLKLRPWMTNHPNLNVLDGGGGCPICKSTKIQSRGWQISPTGRQRRYQCMSCGKWSRGTLEKAGLNLR
jgi:hypothetical protein